VIGADLTRDPGHRSAASCGTGRGNPDTAIERFSERPGILLVTDGPSGLYRLHGDLTTQDAAGGATSKTGHAMDADLLRRVQADDLDAFEEFFARYRSSIYRTAYGLTGDRQAAEEVLQDTFARAYQRRHTLHADVSPLPWLHRVSLNLCYSRLSRRRLTTNPIDETTEASRADDGPLPADRAEQEELRLIVRDGIAALPEKHRSVVVLYYLQRLSLQETAEVLGIQLGTVKSRLHYALRNLRSHLERDRRFGGAYLAPIDEVEANAS
jgi:RNA polymerase sigma-70 factor (ECF subfamily)